MKPDASLLQLRRSQLELGRLDRQDALRRTVELQSHKETEVLALEARESAVLTELEKWRGHCCRPDASAAELAAADAFAHHAKTEIATLRQRRDRLGRELKRLAAEERAVGAELAQNHAALEHVDGLAERADRERSTTAEHEAQEEADAASAAARRRP